MFFLFHPFDDVVLAKVLDNLERSLNAHPRQVWLIYHNPMSRAVLERRGAFKPHGYFRYGSNDSIVYTNNA